MMRRVLLFIFILSLAAGLLTGCGTTSKSASTSDASPAAGEHDHAHGSDVDDAR